MLRLFLSVELLSLIALRVKYSHFPAFQPLPNNNHSLSTTTPIHSFDTTPIHSFDTNHTLLQVIFEVLRETQSYLVNYPSSRALSPISRTSADLCAANTYILLLLRPISNMQNLKMLLFALVAMMLLSVVGADLLTVTTMVTSTSCTKKTITASNPVLTGTTSDFLIRPPTTKQTLSASITLVTPESPKPAEYSFMPTFNAPPLPQPSPCIDNHSWKCIDFRSYTYSYDPATLTPVSGTFTVASRALATETPVDGFIPPPTQAMLQCYYCAYSLLQELSYAC